MKIHGLAVLAAALLSACAGTPDATGEREMVGYIPAGSRLELLVPIRVPAWGDYTYIQAGQVTPLQAVVEVEPHCFLEMRTIKPVPRELQPAVFEIHKVRYLNSPIGWLPGRRFSQWNAAPPSQLFYKVMLYVQSAQEADLFRVTCQVDRYLASGRILQTDLHTREVQQALGGLFRLQPGGA